MTPREAFKVAFCQNCAEHGLSIDETLEVARQALSRVKSSSVGGEVIEAGGRIAAPLVNKLFGVLGTGAFLVPPAAGFGLGYLGSRMTDVDDADVEAVKMRELIDEYRRYSDTLNRRRQTAAPR